jgi:glycosyltransferase involved in cell wall biosynthesis
MTETSPKITVVMAVYNEDEYLSTAINSILKQTFEDFEFLIIDDGSTDKTPEIIEHYAEQDNRIRYLANQANKGLPASLNKGIEHASGKYIARMDADDISLPRRFEKQIEYLDSNPSVHVVGSYASLIGKNGECLGKKTFPQGGRNPEGLKREGPRVPHPSVMMRRSSLQYVSGYREPFRYAQDLDLWIRMSRKFGEDFLGIIPEPLIKYRLTPGQYRRRSVISVYRSYVGKYIGREKELNQQISKEVENQQQENDRSNAKMMYHYRVGRFLVDQGIRSQATSHFIHRIFHRPLSLRGWYGIGLVCLPKSLGKHVTTYVEKYT